MQATAALDNVADLAEQQYGLFTTQQAESVGVPRLTLSRLNDDGLLERVAWGVYRVHGVPRDINESLRAGWLALDPTRMAPKRLADRSTHFTVSYRSAASLHGIGDLPASTHHFTSAVRKQSERARVTVPRTPLDSESVAVVEGLPVTTIERTIADLVKTEADLSQVADAAADADARGALRHDILARELDSVATKMGARSGRDAVEHLLEYRGLDTNSLAQAVLADCGFQASLDAALAQFRPALNNYLATNGVLDAITRPALEAIAQNALSPAYAAMRSAARASAAQSTPDTVEHA